MAFDDSIQKEKNQVHLGRNVQRIREIIGMKQLALAENTGMSQQNISKLEKSPVIPEETLQKLAEGLGVSSEFIKSFNEEKAVYNIQSNFTVNEKGSNINQQYQPIINNPSEIEKIVGLFEKLLQSEKEKTELLAKTNQTLQQLLKETKGKQ
jgi:transcriptional regulator with XRE-family HTH domain